MELCRCDSRVHLIQLPHDGRRHVAKPQAPPIFGWRDAPKFVDGSYLQDDPALMYGTGGAEHAISGTWMDLFRAIRGGRHSKRREPVIRLSYEEKDHEACDSCVHSLYEHDEAPAAGQGTAVAEVVVDMTPPATGSGSDAATPVGVSSQPWHVDFHQPSHVASDAALFLKLHRFSGAQREQQYIVTADGIKFPVLGLGTVLLTPTLASRPKLALFNVLFVPGASQNIISVSKLRKRGFSVTPEAGGLGIYSKRKKVATARPIAGDYELNVE
ncbi:MAG: hypothetical protein M1818_006542 [Claussenomyces sp. TS43310]|nr:MAG: hypothetical protein M1818_006542 [Claussenomyces sp. TS43310]